MINPVFEVPEETDRIQVLPDKVAGIPVQPERRPVPDGFHGPDRGPVVVGNFARVHLVREPHPHLVKHIQNRIPAVREVLIPGVDRLGGHRREHRHILPDGRPGEPHHGLHPQRGGEPGGVLHFLRGALPHPLGIAVAPHNIRQDVPVPLIDGIIAYRLALQMVGDGVNLEPVLLQDVAAALDVLLVIPPPRVQMVAPAGNLQTVIPPLRSKARHFLERQVGPLAGEQGD